MIVNIIRIKLVLGIMVSKDFHLEQLDINTTYLHSDLEEKLIWQNLKDSR